MSGIQNRIYYSRSDIEHLIAEAQGMPAGAEIEVEWNDDHSAVIVLPDEDRTGTVVVRSAGRG